MSEPLLKPCPFCGFDARLHGDVSGWFVGCARPIRGEHGLSPEPECFAAVGEYYIHDMPEHHYVNEAEAITAWNRRVERPSVEPEAM